MPYFHTRFAIDDKNIIATFADDTPILASDSDPILASEKLESSLDQIDKWLHKWRIRANTNKSVHVAFTLRRGTCPPVSLNGNILPQSEVVKYLGMHLDKRLTWQKHIWAKRKQLNIKFKKYLWLLNRNSKLSLDNKLLVYKAILKPVWTYGIQLWGTASVSNIEIIQRFQSKVLRELSDSPWYVRNDDIHRS